MYILLKNENFKITIFPIPISPKINEIFHENEIDSENGDREGFPTREHL